MKIEKELGVSDLGAAVLIDLGCFPPFLGNALRFIAGSSEEIDVDYIEPKDINDTIWIMGTIASFLPVATIITIKEMIKQKRSAILKED